VIQKEESASIESDAGIQITKKDFITILVCVGISMFFMRSTLLSLVYLVPLGYAVIVTGFVWYTFVVAAATNIILTIGLSLSGSFNPENILFNIIYVTIMYLGFIWIIGGKNLRTVYRFILASGVGTLAVLIILNRQDAVFNIIFKQLTEDLPLFSYSETIDLVKNILLRGGAFISMCFLFFINRQIALTAVWLIKKKRNHRSLSEFFAPLNTIWVLSGSLFSILVFRFFRIEILEIMAWNVFTICVIIFLAQGTGILQYLLSRRTKISKLIIIAILIFVLFSPLSLITVIALLILGIVDSWVPFRKEKVPRDEPHTPGSDL